MRAVLGSHLQHSHTILGGGQGKWALWQFCPTTGKSLKNALPSLENFIVVTWIQLLHPDLPRLVKQSYGTELRCRTLASIKPDISHALDSLLEEFRTSEEAKVLRTIHTSLEDHPASTTSHLPLTAHTPQRAKRHTSLVQINPVHYASKLAAPTIAPTF